MHKSLWFITAVIICVLCAFGAYSWAMGMIESNYDYRSPLMENPPQPGQPVGKAATDRVVIVLIDALRYDTSLKTEIMPVLNSLRSQGASALMHSQPPSFSEPGYATILTGAWPEINDGPVFNLDYEDIPVLTQDNLFSAAKRKGLVTAVSGYYWFEKLIPQNDVDFHFYTPGEDAAADRDVVDAALPWLEEDQADLILIHLDQVDYAGHHEGGAASVNWDNAAKRCDDLLAEILSRVDLGRETIVVLSDHAQINAGGHGGNENITLSEPLVMAGKGVIPGIYEDMRMVDLAPTLSALLGLNLPASTQGQVLSTMLVLPDETISGLPEITIAQQTALLNAYRNSLDPQYLDPLPQTPNVAQFQSEMTLIRQKRLFQERLWRAIPAALFLAAIFVWLIRKWKAGAMGWILGGIITAAVFHLCYAFIDRKTYSLSSVTSETDLILYVGLTTLAGFILSWLLISILWKVFKMNPNQSARFTFLLGFAAVFILSLPSVLSFVLNEFTITWTLPEFTTSFLALLSLIQIIIVSALTPILAGITSLIAHLKNKTIKQEQTNDQYSEQLVR